MHKIHKKTYFPHAAHSFNDSTFNLLPALWVSLVLTIYIYIRMHGTAPLFCSRGPHSGAANIAQPALWNMPIMHTSRVRNVGNLFGFRICELSHTHTHSYTHQPPLLMDTVRWVGCKWPRRSPLWMGVLLSEWCLLRIYMRWRVQWEMFWLPI